MQLAGFFVHKKRHGHAPLALARQSPVRPIGNHGMQPGSTPGWIKAGGVNAGQRFFTQGTGLIFGLAIHAGKPLTGGAINNRRFMTPAMHITVLVAFHMHQRACLLHGLDDLGIGVPDRLAAEQGQGGDIFAVGHDRADNVRVRHAIGLAGLEVFHTIRGGRVNNTGAGIDRDIFAQVDGRQAIVTRIGAGQRMAERNVVQRLSGAFGNHRAFQLPVFKTGLHPILGQQQQGAGR